MNWVLFDNQFNYVAASSGFQQVGSDQEFKHHILLNLPVTASGYLYIYASNATPNVDVFFDNLQVTHTRGPLLEENHYYAGGLTMAGISDRALKSNYAENKYRWNKGSELQNKEFSDGSGLEMYDTHFRQLDPQLGRWWQIDPKPDEATSPYTSMGNNPILRNDPLGDTLDFPITDNNFVEKFYDAFAYLDAHGAGDNLMALQKATRHVMVLPQTALAPDSYSDNPDGVSVIFWSPENGLTQNGITLGSRQK